MPSQALPKALAPALANLFVDPRTKQKLAWESDRLVAANGASFPVIRGIPRFVSSDHYVNSFSLEWNTHNNTQLDSVTGSSASEAFFREKTGLTPEDVKGRVVLDAGIGAGRFSDILSRWGANVVGVDLSYAVEASHVNFIERENVLVAQADIGNLPFAPETFDIIVSIGVLHHTPNTEKYFKALVPLLKRGGRISIWVYPKVGDYITRNEWIPYTSRIPSKMFYSWCRWFVPFALNQRDRRWVQIVRKLFPFSDQGLGMENDILDTFDGYSPTYHGIHSPEEVVGWFEQTGLRDVQALPYLTAVTGVK
ncbi:MAG TPA: class I SAM-dependent methyltransferase [Aliidongia sp.]|nr:class I SAM-dependent methyltransferase [Aliidongia sp.]